MRAVRCIGVLEKEGGVAAAIAEGLLRWGAETGSGRQPPFLLVQTTEGHGHLCERQPELLVLTGPVAGEAGGPLPCHYLLVPGEAAGTAAQCLAPACAVSYGMSQRDSLTLSSTAGDRIVLALQRELTTLDGQILERQEIPLRAWCRVQPRTLLAAAGALLLLGVPPERLMDMGGP